MVKHETTSITSPMVTTKSCTSDFGGGGGGGKYTIRSAVAMYERRHTITPMSPGMSRQEATKLAISIASGNDKSNTSIDNAGIIAPLPLTKNSDTQQQNDQLQQTEAPTKSAPPGRTSSLNKKKISSSNSFNKKQQQKTLSAESSSVTNVDSNDTTNNDHLQQQQQQQHYQFDDDSWDEITVEDENEDYYSYEEELIIDEDHNGSGGAIYDEEYSYEETVESDELYDDDDDENNSDDGIIKFGEPTLDQHLQPKLVLEFDDIEELGFIPPPAGHVKPKGSILRQSSISSITNMSLRTSMASTAITFMGDDDTIQQQLSFDDFNDTPNHNQHEETLKYGDNVTCNSMNKYMGEQEPGRILPRRRSVVWNLDLENNAAKRIQCIARKYIIAQKFLTQKQNAAIQIQSTIRNYMAKCSLQAQKLSLQRNNAACLIQSMFRQYCARQIFLKHLFFIQEFIQPTIRGFLVRQLITKQHGAARIIQSIIRGRQGRKQFTLHQSARSIERIIRGYLVRNVTYCSYILRLKIANTQRRLDRFNRETIVEKKLQEKRYEWLKEKAVLEQRKQIKEHRKFETIEMKKELSVDIDVMIAANEELQSDTKRWEKKINTMKAANAKLEGENEYIVSNTRKMKLYKKKRTAENIHLQETLARYRDELTPSCQQTLFDQSLHIRTEEIIKQKFLKCMERISTRLKTNNNGQDLELYNEIHEMIQNTTRGALSNDDNCFDTADDSSKEFSDQTVPMRSLQVPPAQQQQQQQKQQKKKTKTKSKRRGSTGAMSALFEAVVGMPTEDTKSVGKVSAKGDDKMKRRASCSKIANPKSPRSKRKSASVPEFTKAASTGKLACTKSPRIKKKSSTVDTSAVVATVANTTTTTSTTTVAQKLTKAASVGKLAYPKSPKAKRRASVAAAPTASMSCLDDGSKLSSPKGTNKKKAMVKGGSSTLVSPKTTTKRLSVVPIASPNFDQNEKSSSNTIATSVISGGKVSRSTPKLKREPSGRKLASTGSFVLSPPPLTNNINDYNNNSFDESHGSESEMIKPSSCSKIPSSTKQTKKQILAEAKMLKKGASCSLLSSTTTTKSKRKSSTSKTSTSNTLFKKSSSTGKSSSKSKDKTELGSPKTVRKGTKEEISNEVGDSTCTSKVSSAEVVATQTTTKVTKKESKQKHSSSSSKKDGGSSRNLKKIASKSKISTNDEKNQDNPQIQQETQGPLGTPKVTKKKSKHK